MNNLLIVYNTFGQRDNSLHYFKCLDSILNCKLPEKTKIVISSCFNSNLTRRNLVERYRDQIQYVFIDKRYPVNITFNKAVQLSVSSYGEFKYYLYLDSGIDFIDNSSAIESAITLLDSDKYGLLSFQVSNDHALYNVGINNFPLKGKNHEVPIGTACNGHAEIFTNLIFKTFNNKLIPDIFSAFCTESTFSFLTAAINKKWVILGDYVLNHSKSVDGASSSSHHISPVYFNTWNNLMFNRNALDFIHDKEAIEAGLGYEECNNIMLHKKECYTDDGFSKNPNELARIINKYYYLNNTELNYDTI